MGDLRLALANCLPGYERKDAGGPEVEAARIVTACHIAMALIPGCASNAAALHTA